MEKMLIASRSAVASAMVQAGGKMNLDAAGLAVMSGLGHLPGVASSAAPGPQPEGPERKKDKDKDKRKSKKKAK